MDFYNFYTGKEFEAQEFLGAHVSKEGTTFRTFAPAAMHIAVIGEFNDWTETPMHKIHDGNFWECTIAQAKPGMMYKYRIYRQDGSFIDHADPYAFYSEMRPASASIIHDRSTHKFHDEKWLRKRKNTLHSPLNIYELHFGSWRKKTEEEDGWYSYEELADIAVPYLKENGYNYVELMPLCEYPCDASWGYQATGYFSPTSRYGTPEGLCEFVDKCHQQGIGVILDFVPVHFAVNDYALWNYDGTALFEYPNSAVGVNEWGSCNFMHSRGETCSFLQSAAYFWLKEYHFDGLRMDAVGNLIYWQGNPARGECKPAIQFLQVMNQGLKDRMPDVLLIAEDSSSWIGVTKPVSEGGLGFDYKWDLGWMNDTLAYFSAEPRYRTQMYHKLTFSMQYFYDEHFLLPLSHDEVVHGKAAILQKMGTEYERKFPQARALYMYMYAHPGRKLNFMGNELGQLREWDEKREQDWCILDYPIHDAFHRFMRDLNHCYLENPALSQEDYRREGFCWIDCHQEEKNVYVFQRKCSSQTILAVFNFSDREQEYELPDMTEWKLKLLMDSERDIYGGCAGSVWNGKTDGKSEEVNRNLLILPPFCGRYYIQE